MTENYDLNWLPNMTEDQAFECARHYDWYPKAVQSQAMGILSAMQMRFAKNQKDYKLHIESYIKRV